VHEGDQLRHLRHLHDAREVKANGTTNDHGADDPGKPAPP
jgi:hypothetical protein